MCSFFFSSFFVFPSHINLFLYFKTTGCNNTRSWSHGHLQMHVYVNALIKKDRSSQPSARAMLLFAELASFYSLRFCPLLINRATRHVQTRIQNGRGFKCYCTQKICISTFWWQWQKSFYIFNSSVHNYVKLTWVSVRSTFLSTQTINFVYLKQINSRQKNLDLVLE